MKRAYLVYHLDPANKEPPEGWQIVPDVVTVGTLQTSSNNPPADILIPANNLAQRVCPMLDYYAANRQARH